MTTEKRLERLEVELGRARLHTRLWGGVALLVGIGALAGGLASCRSAADSGTYSEIRANRIVIQDDGGRVRALLAVVDGGVGLSLADEAGTVRALLSYTGGTPTLSLHDASGKTRAVMGVVGGGGSMGVLDASGRQVWGTP